MLGPGSGVRGGFLRLLANIEDNRQAGLLRVEGLELSSSQLKDLVCSFELRIERVGAA